MSSDLRRDEHTLISFMHKSRLRVTRLVRRVQKYLRLRSSYASEDDLIRGASVCTLKSCIAIPLSIGPLDSFRGGFLFYYWLLLAGPSWTIAPLQVNLEVYSSFFFLFPFPFPRLVFRYKVSLLIYYWIVRRYARDL